MNRVEIQRIEDVSLGSALDLPCQRCQREITLWWNGGEGDEYVCVCGLIYTLAGVRYDVIISEPRPVHHPYEGVISGILAAKPKEQ